MMKRSRLFFVLLFVLCVMGVLSAAAEETLMIRSVYGGGVAADNACASTHSYVELYNAGDTEVSLTGYSLQYKTADTDPWIKLNLSGSVPAHSFFLVRGASHIANRLYISGSVGRINLYDADYDQSWQQLINNKSMKVVLMHTTALLLDPNPFDIDGEGTKAEGYVDMVSAVGTDTTTEIAETEAAQGISKQKCIFRVLLTDTDNNRADFAAVDLRTADLETYAPRSVSSGPYEGETYTEVPDTIPPIVINQFYGGGSSSDNGTAVTHSFVELYNPTDSDVSLSGWSLQYAQKGTVYARLKLTGTIPAHCSYLVRGGAHISDKSYIKGTVGRLNLFDCDYDASWDIGFNNKGAKLILMATTRPLDVVNPSDMDGEGTPVAGYVDMIGAGNTAADTDGYETKPAVGQSKQKALCRIFCRDTQNNEKDFIVIDYRTVAIAEIAPRSTKAGAWQSTDDSLPLVPERLSPLMINQVYGGGWKLDCPFSHTFVELYNAGDEAISLDGCSLQYGEIGGFTDYAPLDGYTIPAKCCFLIRCLDNPEMLVGTHFIRYDMTEDTTFDLSLPEFVISNDSFRVGIVYGVDHALGSAVDPALAPCMVDYVFTNDISKQQTLRATNYEKGNMDTLRFELVSDAFVEDYRPRSLNDGPQYPRNDLRYYAATVKDLDPAVDDYVERFPAGGTIEIGTVYNNLTGSEEVPQGVMVAVQYDEQDRVIDVVQHLIAPSKAGVHKEKLEVSVKEDTNLLKIFMWDKECLSPYVARFAAYTKQEPKQDDEEE